MMKHRNDGTPDAGPVPKYLIAAILVAGACVAPHLPDTHTVRLPDRIRVQVAGRVVAVPLEDYVVAAALSELTPLNEPPETVARAFEVQTVLARTYAAAHLGRHRARGFDLCNRTHCQLYEPGRRQTSRFAAAAIDAARRTRGVVLLHEGRPADAPFHADCGGHTAANAAVWGGPPQPYLMAKPDAVPAAVHRTWTLTVPPDRMRQALNAGPATQVGRRLTSVRVTKRDASGRATAVEIAGEHTRVVTGEALRAAINALLGDRAIQSTRLSIARQAGGFVFTGTGFGHGVGLCQAGALARARLGESAEEIFEAYFEGLVAGR
jgi:stage II sporulation protein D